MPDSLTRYTVIAALLLCAPMLTMPAAHAAGAVVPGGNLVTAGYVYGESQSFRTEGVVSMVDPDRDRATITTSDGRQYKLDTGDTMVRLRTTTQPGETGDLVVGMHVQVSGRLLSSNVVAADTVTVLPYDGNRPTEPQPSYRTVERADAPTPVPVGADKHIRLRGTVEGVDDQDGILTVHVRS